MVIAFFYEKNKDRRSGFYIKTFLLINLNIDNTLDIFSLNSKNIENIFIS